MTSCCVAFSDEFLRLVARYPVAGTVCAALALLGVYKVWSVVYSLQALLRDTLMPRRSALRRYGAGSKAGAWALVTGATAGIGEEFAAQLACAGFNVALVSRTQAKLDAVAERIAAKYNVKTSTFALDMVTATPSDFEMLATWARELGAVRVLVNNVGQSHEMPVPFAETPTREMRDIIQVNNVATLGITHALLPVLRSAISNGRDRALILTMGSFAGLTPTPLLATYSGSKAFLQGWSSALAPELAPERIDVQLVVSYLVTSQMSKVRRTSAMVPNPRAFVAATLRCLGRRGGAQERAFTVTPYWSHALLHWAIESTLGVWSALVARMNYRMHVDIRRRALRKRDREAAQRKA